MTTLSIFLYLADILNSLRSFVTICGILFLFVPVCAYLGQDEFDIENPGKCLKWCIPITVLCFLIACVIPEKKTMHMIAGVELANTVMESEDFNKVKNYLGNSGVEMIDDIKALIHAEAQDALEQTKKEQQKEH